MMENKGPIEMGNVAENKSLDFLDVQKGQTYVVEKNNERYEIKIDSDPVKPDQIEIKRITPGALHGQPDTVSLDDLNRMIRRATGGM